MGFLRSSRSRPDGRDIPPSIIDTLAQNDRANSLLRQGRWLEAISLLDQVRQHPRLEPDSKYSAIAFLAMAYVAIGECHQARALAGSAPVEQRALSAGLQQCLFMRGIARYLLGERAQALRDLERVYAANPSFKGIQEAKAGMVSGTFHFDYYGQPVARAQ
jgi:tetratricopeptide (TPR) repeat protein